MLKRVKGGNSNVEWTYQSSPWSIRIVEKESWDLLFIVESPTQHRLVLVSNWIDDHNRLIRRLNELLATKENSSGTS